MRGGLSGIQQTLTPEAATVLSHSIAEAGRRNHGQTTPLHVAATLLASPTGYLRQACIRSHPNSSHPLQCRALELCFSVALERLPTAQHASAAVAEPPLSNALMAALKRAQAHQRRGCPEQQQQPLLAVKVELEQFIISILDDPSVSRVMREASFSSPAVKAAIEQAVNSQPNSGPGPKIGLGFRPGLQPGLGVAPPGTGGRSLYLNPRLRQHHQQQQGSNGFQSWKGREDDMKRVMEILLRPKKRNPVLVGESEPREVVREVFRRIQRDEIRDKILENVEVVLVEKELGSDSSQILARFRELDGLVEKKMMMNSNGESGIILDLGDLKWLVDQPANQGVSDLARGVVTEMGKILRKYGEGSKLWLIGTATCETYMRCQVYHPSMESEWDLQVVSILARSPAPGMLPRLGSNGGILSSSVECLSPMKSFQMAALPLTKRFSENLDPLRRLSCCPLCLEKYNQELGKLQAEKSLSEEKTDATRQSLPLWLQNARLNSNDSAKGAPDSIQNKDQDSILRQRTQELQKKWSETCLQLHPGIHQGLSSERIIPSHLTMTGSCNPILLGRQPFQPKLQTQKSLGDALQLSISSPIAHQLNSDYPTSSPGSPVGTDLVLGRTKPTETAQDKTNNGCLKDFLNCISSESHNKKFEEFQGTGRPVIPADVDSFKKLLKGLMEKVWWQTEAASALASAITQCKSGNGKQRVGSKGDIWLLFSGPDRTGKKKMATALSELVCGVAPILISLGSRRDSDEPYSNFRGKTVIDQIAEAIRRNPFSVIMLQDIDEADLLIRGSIKRAMERGRLVDSYGREISLGKVIFILTSNWVPDQVKSLSGPGFTLNEEKLLSLASGGWQLRISVGEKPSGKRSPSWLNDDHHQDRVTKQRKEVCPGCSIDLNQTADIDDDRLDGSHNSSDLTVDHEEEHGHDNRESPTTSSAAPELLTFVDEAIIFEPVDFTSIRQNIERTILAKFSSIAGDKFLLELQSLAIEKILSGIWLGQTTLETWIEKVLMPSIDELKTSSTLLTHEGKMVAKLELDKESENRGHGVWLPGRISVVVDVQ